MGMNNKRVTAALVLVALIAAACGDADDTATSTSLTPDPTPPPGSTQAPGPAPGAVPFVPGELARFDAPVADVTVTEAELAAVARADAAFGLDLLRVVAGDDNVMVSPYSVATALSMLLPGARNATAAEIAAVLHLTGDEDAMHRARTHIERVLATTSAPMGEEDNREPFVVRPANLAWGQGGYPFLAPYLERLATSYGAGLRLVDFATAPDASRGIINGWVEDATEGRIEDLIPDGVITTLTRLVLVNAIWFKANWEVPFDPERTTPAPFTRLDGSTVDVPMMHVDVRTGYAATDLFEAVRLRYAGDAAMVVAVPRSGSPAELAARLTVDDLAVAWGDFQVELAMPRFEFESDVGLKAALQALGMNAAFEAPVPGEDGTADLTGITESRELFVQDALHKTFVALDENGTEAAAATALVVGLTSLPEPATLTVDRPFLFWIESTSTGEILFLGQVTDPSAS